MFAIRSKKINRRRTKLYLMDLYERKQPINIDSIPNKQLLFQVACRYNDLKTADYIIETSRTQLYMTKAFRSSFKYYNIDTTIMILECGIWLEGFRFTFKKYKDFILTMIENGLDVKYLVGLRDYGLFQLYYITTYTLYEYISVKEINNIILNYMYKN